MDYEAYDTGDSRFIDTNIYVNKVYVNVCEPYHAHNFIEIVLIDSGSGWHIINGEKISVQPGDIIIVDYDVPHKSISGNEQLVVRNCLFTVSTLDKQHQNSRSFCDALLSCSISSKLYSNFSSYLRIRTSGDNKYQIISLYEKMLKEYNRKLTGYPSMLRSYLTELLILIARIYEENDSKQSSVINSVKEYIIENYKKNITLDEISSNVFLSSQYLCKIFKENTGTTIIQFLQQIRIEQAIQSILSTDKKISDIAASVGYSDLKHFNSIFKKITGTTPSKMRRFHEKTDDDR